MALKVVIVDDSAAMRRIIERTLHQIGLAEAEIHHAATGTEVVPLLKKSKGADLILCDQHMDPVTGLEVVKQLRASPEFSHIPIVMISADSDASTLAQAKSAGVSDYINKPFGAAKLREAVDTALKGGQAPASPPPKATANFVEAAMEGVQEAFRTLLGIHVQRQHSKLIQDPRPFDGVSAIIGLAGTTTFSIHCGLKLAVFMTTKMFGCAVTESSPELKDAMGEIANVAAGVIRRKMGQGAAASEMYLPRVVTGPAHRVDEWVKWPVYSLEFATSTDSSSLFTVLLSRG